MGRSRRVKTIEARARRAIAGLERLRRQRDELLDAFIGLAAAEVDLAQRRGELTDDLSGDGIGAAMGLLFHRERDSPCTAQNGAQKKSVPSAWRAPIARMAARYSGRRCPCGSLR
jgi:hypothetical protein